MYEYDDKKLISFLNTHSHDISDSTSKLNSNTMSSTTSTPRAFSKSKKSKQFKQSKKSKQFKQPGLTATVSGAKELDEYIAQVSGMITQIQETFMHELADSEARCRKQRCRGSSHDFAMEMCGITHAGVVYTETVLNQSSAFLQALAVANECLDQLEALRKMLVNNKQQKKTAIRRLREFRNYIGSMVESFALQNMLLGTSTGTGAGAPKKTSILEERRRREELQTRENLLELGMELEPTQPKPTARMIQDMIEMTKQNHRTVSKGLIDQANTLMSAMRARHIRNLAEVAERTVVLVKDHEKKCQAFMTQCLRLSAIEYCAKIWWFGTQNPDPNSSKNYYIRTEVVHDYGDAVEGKGPTCLDHHFKASRAAAYFEFCAENRPVPRICITVHGDPDPEGGNNNPLICKYELDQELAETILTDEAIDQFEEARRA